MAQGDHLSREELFELVWSKPTREVARELGVSDTAVSKLCTRKQVPKPPRGYWARVASGRTPARPPLPAFIEENQRREKQSDELVGVRLSPRRHELFLEVASLVDDSPQGRRFEIRSGRLYWIDPEFAAAMLFRLQRDAKRWFSEERVSAQYRLALARSVEDLVHILLEHAPGFTALFTPDASRRSVGSVQAISVRLSPTLRQTIARMAQIVRENDLAHVARPLDRGDVGWRCRYVGDAARYISATTTLYVSVSEAWVEGTSRLTDAVFQSMPLSLWDLVPEDELGVRVTELPKVLSGYHSDPYADELRRIREATKVLTMTLEAVHDREDLPVPGQELPDAARMWLSQEERRALQVASEATESIHRRAEQWETELELTQQRLAESVLDAHPGDVAIVSMRGRTVRLLTEHVSGFPTEEGFLMRVTGRPFRKDGKPGKRRDEVYVMAPWDRDETRLIE